MTVIDTQQQTIARRALRHFNVPESAALMLAGDGHNIVYRVYTDSAAYALRLSAVNYRPSVWRVSEGIWLRLLADTGLRVPEPVGTYYAPDVDGSGYDASLFTWVDGDPLTVAGYTADRLHALGVFTARLHEAARAATLPPDFVRPTLDAAALLGKHAADGTPSQYTSSDEDSLFDASQRAVLRAMRAPVEATFATLEAATPGQSFGLIHADLIAKNVVFSADGEPGVIDFDECAFGAFLYDLAPALWLVRHTPEYADHRAALWAGYTSIRPQPDDHLAHIETLVAARHAASCRWLAANAPHNDDTRHKLYERFNELRRFLDTGMIHHT